MPIFSFVDNFSFNLFYLSIALIFFHFSLRSLSLYFLRTIFFLFFSVHFPFSRMQFRFQSVKNNFRLTFTLSNFYVNFSIFKTFATREKTKKNFDWWVGVSHLWGTEAAFPYRWERAQKTSENIAKTVCVFVYMCVFLSVCNNAKGCHGNKKLEVSENVHWRSIKIGSPKFVSSLRWR